MMCGWLEVEGGVTAKDDEIAVFTSTVSERCDDGQLMLRIMWLM